jgi:hypothetical protein
MYNFHLGSVLWALKMMRNHMNIIMAKVAAGEGHKQLDEKYKENVLNCAGNIFCPRLRIA